MRIAVNGAVRLALASGLGLVLLASPSPSAPMSPDRLVEVADLAAPVVSPDGFQVAFRLEQASISRNAYSAAWYVQAMDGSKPPRRVADGIEPLIDSAGGLVPEEAHWSPDGRFIYFRALSDGKVDIWRAAADGSGAKLVTLDPANVHEFSLGADGKVLSYSVGATRDELERAEQGEHDRGIRIDETVPIGAGLFRSARIEGRWATQRYSGIWFDRGTLLARAPARWKQINLETGLVRDLASPPLRAAREVGSSDPEGKPEPWKMATDPVRGRIALLTRQDVEDGSGEYRVALSMRPSSGARRAITCGSEACQGKVIDSVLWRPGANEVLFTVRRPGEGLAQAIYRWNVESGAVRPVAQSSGLISGGRDWYSACGISAEALACVMAGADRPPRLVRIEIDTGRQTMMFAPNEPLAADMAEAIESRFLRWRDAKGNLFTGHLFVDRRAHQEPRPLFVSYYICPGFLRGGMGDEWPLASLAEVGIAALCINALPHQPDPIRRYDEGLQAVQAVVDLLASEGEIDADKVGMGGLSFGSEVALWVAARSRILAAVSLATPSISPLYHLLGSLKGEMFSSGLRDVWGLGAPSETPEQWERISPTQRLDSIVAPVLFQVPEQEYMYALDYAIPLIRSCRADFYAYPNEAHQKFLPRHKLSAYERNLDWFRFWLQGFESPDAEKAGQYKYWNSMRKARVTAGKERGVKSGGAPSSQPCTDQKSS